MRGVNILKIDSEDVEKHGLKKYLKRRRKGILIPGGFGARGHRGEDRVGPKYVQGKTISRFLGFVFRDARSPPLNSPAECGGPERGQFRRSFDSGTSYP